MSRKALQLKASERCINLMKQEQNRYQLEKHYHLRFRIALESLAGKQNIEIASSLPCHEQTVLKWRKRFWQHQEALLAYEKSDGLNPVSDKELVDKIKEILSDAPRPGAPPRISQSDRDRLVALACEPPEKYGLPFTHWTHKELSKQAVKMGIILSPSHLGRILKKRLTSAQERLLDTPKN